MKQRTIFFVNRMLHFFSLLKGSRPVPWLSVKILMAVTWNWKRVAKVEVDDNVELNRDRIFCHNCSLLIAGNIQEEVLIILVSTCLTDELGFWKDYLRRRHHYHQYYHFCNLLFLSYTVNTQILTLSHMYSHLHTTIFTRDAMSSCWPGGCLRFTGTRGRNIPSTTSSSPQKWGPD